MKLQKFAQTSTSEEEEEEEVEVLREHEEGERLPPEEEEEDPKPAGKRVRFSVEGNEKRSHYHAFEFAGNRHAIMARKNKKNEDEHEQRSSKDKGLQFKSNLLAIVREFESANITKRLKNELIKTPFWTLIESILKGSIDKHICRKSDLTAYKILLTYVKDEEVFRIKDKDVKIYARDVKMIFGIRDGNRQIDLKKQKAAKMRKKTAFETRCFPKLERLTKGEINKAFKRLSNIESKKLTDENVRDMCRVLVLKMLVSLFLPNNGSNLPWAYLEYVEDMKSIREYNWTQHIFEFFKKSLDEKEASEVIGCVMMIPYWFCEHTKIIEPIEEGRIPRCAKWNLLHLEAELRKKPFVDTSFSVIRLEPTGREVELLGVQRAVELLEDSEETEIDAQNLVRDKKGKMKIEEEEEETESIMMRNKTNEDDEERKIGELKCENQKLKYKLKKAEEEIKRLEKAKK